MSTCTCIVWHPQTDEEREMQKANFERARNLGDMATAMLYLASLSGDCPTQTKEGN